MIQHRARRVGFYLVRTALFLVLVVAMLALLSWQHDRYHARDSREGHVLVCGGNITDTEPTRLLKGCRLMRCTEILSSGEVTRWYFAYC